VVEGVEEDLIEVHKLEVVVVEAVEELEVCVLILEGRVVVGVGVHTQLETGRSLPSY
jgi:hypothetical protein